MKGPKAVESLLGINTYLKNGSVDKGLLELVDYRVSQINQCAFCLDMHSKELRALGETEQRLYTLDAWKETPFFTDRERAALGWAEAVTACEVSDEVYETAKEQFSDEELVDLTMAVCAINTWNRLNIAFPNKVGSYQVGKF
ncbi:carboxymuconolactone decarboxylase family protein [Flagellimonas sp.]|uniref:carboxymuconolactone decarboxylase family protein n=1 Tax=Flagellimonas sp. TaxID=2058762 RepID=UPI003AB2850A